jgi:hypothetical protein
LRKSPRHSFSDMLLVVGVTAASVLSQKTVLIMSKRVDLIVEFVRTLKLRDPEEQAVLGVLLDTASARQELITELGDYEKKKIESERKHA